MRYVDEYRAPEQVMQLVAHLQQRARLLPHTAARPLRIMEVCGGHTHAIFKFGLDQLLPETIRIYHGVPAARCASCPDEAPSSPALNCQPPGSDLPAPSPTPLRVPGKNGSLCRRKPAGRDVRIVYSPMNALRWRSKNPRSAKAGLFVLGFETTMPLTP
ncbi:hypothetical protein LAD77_29930 [Klebsiella pneumoniae]|nr:hypothetical protein [Klebsiella pneumoniae]